MTTKIVKINHPELKDFIQYFIFFKSEKDEVINYTTFPNTNLCLAIYKKNNVVLHRKGSINQCTTLQGTQTYLSYLVGFHKTAFQMSVQAPIDEICVLFHPSALRLFTNVPYAEMQDSNEVFQMIFPNSDRCFLEALFEEQDDQKRASNLEFLFLKSLKKDLHSDKIKEALDVINSKKDNKLDVATIAKALAVNESTLYRLFTSQLGQNPKSFLKTIRFRNVLEELLTYQKVKLTGIAHQSNYADQSHFIKDFKDSTGQTPTQVKNKTKIQQEELAWIYTEK
ncbi:helix-turn-helix domain-containing protein [Flavobacterium kingsejongi]|uniref:HTH araC/xylS-type domain-containing protein n=1 Tax=Flavobacterium kingsejongi TaxID=1678728 RepID=A0A2S1LQH9_9FLAO|nr:helix-turn-helix domain-containing protein [Flavobacterium kingsejongi]AWG25994.1 hypothetical protein FK004_12560 [Flavobacterium kingsejongi]